MPVKALCASHTPLKDIHFPGAEAAAEVDRCFAQVRSWIADFAPQLVIAFGPDHFNSFFYQLMPSFCIGAAAESVGDWKTPLGEVPVASETAGELVRYLHQHDIDAAISLRMQLDHGFTQTLNLVFEWSTLPPIIPIFINCAAAPLPTFSRAATLGRVIGEFVRGRSERILLVGSGGLSHDPPIPTLATAPPEVRERLIAGGDLVLKARAAREIRIAEEGSRQARGESPQVPLNPAWDRAFLDRLMARDFSSFASFDDAELTREAGCGSHEVRTWVATAAAMSILPDTRATLHMYRAIPIWIAGFAVMTFE